jgi:stringent starvation protein B
LQLGNDYIEFKGRFGGVARDILVPVDRVLAIYAKENGQGMAFPLLASSASPAPEATATPPASTLTTVSSDKPDPTNPDGPRPSGGGRPSLTRVK